MSDKKSEVPQAVVERMVDIEHEFFALADKHGVGVKMEIRWPDGLRISKRTLNAREKAARATAKP